MSKYAPTSSSIDRDDEDRPSHLGRLGDVLLSFCPEQRPDAVSPLKALTDLWDAGKVF